jgi:hypothetical protein
MGLRRKLTFIAATAACGWILAATAQANGLPPDDTSNLVTFEPDDYADGVDVSTIFPGVTLSAFGGDPDFGFPLNSDRIFARVPHQASAIPPTGELVFGLDTDFFNTGFYFGGHQFRATFAHPTNYVSIQTALDGNPDVDPTDFALIQIFASDGTMLDSFTTLGDASIVEFPRAERDIAYLIATNPPENPGDSFMLDALVFRTSAIPEPGTWALFCIGIVFFLLTRARQRAL